MVSSCKWETLKGHKLLMVEPLDEELKPISEACAATWPKLEEKMTKELIDEFRKELAPK